MRSFEEGRCRRCGAELAARSAEGLCPACLLSGALEPEDSKAETISLLSGEPAPRSPEPSDFPCEFGGYRLIGLLGRGGMGTVFEAEQTATGRRVAVKMLGRQLNSPDMRQRFLREGRLAAGINHPNSLYIFGSEEIEGIPVITMEIAGSGTLKDRLKRQGPLPVSEAVDAILDVIAGLEAAFAAGVLHRDIKPSNCFVSPDGSVKVGDFGLAVSTLAKEQSFATATGVIMGTPAYSSPEQLRGNELDLRADIYSVGATLFTLLTDHAPFEGDNVVHVVANALNQEPKPTSEMRHEVPPALDRVVARCLAKKPDERYADYTALREALLPFSSREPEPASIKVRASAGWVDFLIAFMTPYVPLMVFVGPEELLIRPLVERTLYSARFYIALFSFGFLYFSIAEGIWGAGLGKRLRGLQVVRTDGRLPGIGRAFIRILIPILSVEGVRMPLMMASISGAEWTGLQTALFVGSAVLCGWIPVLLSLTARPGNGFATVWDLASGTRVVVKPKGRLRPAVEPVAQPEAPVADGESMGPYRITGEIYPGRWVVASDPVLRRQVWLLWRRSNELSHARRNLARPGRLRWLQKVDTAEGTWDAFEATQGVPFRSLVERGKRVPWSSLRHWLYDLASELTDATIDHTLPEELSLDHVWVTRQGNAVLLDEPWPRAERPAKTFLVGSLAGQQRFLDAVAACVDSTSLPLHARPILQNLKEGNFAELRSFAGILRGLLDRPVEVSKGIRAGSIFMLPIYVWILVFLGIHQGGRGQQWSDSPGLIVLVSTAALLGAIALVQLLEIPFHTTVGHSVFRLAVVNARGETARPSQMLLRWAIVWLPLLVPMSLVAVLFERDEPAAALVFALIVLSLWIGAAIYAVIHPNRGLHDRLAGTWIIRR
jgi:uncharacterized RDD family membrane protein YckC